MERGRVPIASLLHIGKRSVEGASSPRPAQIATRSLLAIDMEQYLIASWQPQMLLLYQVSRALLYHQSRVLSSTPVLLYQVSTRQLASTSLAIAHPQ